MSKLHIPNIIQVKILRLNSVLLLLLANALFAQGQIISKDSLSKLSSQGYKCFEVYDVKKAIEIGVSIIDISERQKDFYYSHVGYNILGMAYLQAKDTIKARSSYEKALEVAKKSKADSMIARAYANLGFLESNSKVNYLNRIDYFKKSIGLNKKINREKDNLIPSLNIGRTYLDQNQVDQAYFYLERANNLIDMYAPHDYRLKTAIDLEGGRYHLKKGNLNKSEELLSNAARLADKNENGGEIEKVYTYYSQLEEAKGNYNQALIYLKKSKEYERKMLESQKTQEMQAASAKFQYAQEERNLVDAEKEKEFAQQLGTKSNYLNYILIAATVILLAAFIGIYIAFKSRKRYIRRLHKKNKQLEEAKQKAEKLSKLKTQFFSTVSHELRTPLYGVIGLSTLLLDENKNPDLKDDLKSLKFSADYLLSLINDVLLMSKMDAEGIEIQKVPFKLSDLTQNITRSFEFSLEQNNNKIHLNVDPKIPNNLIGDPVRLSQILMNLIGNAIKFNENGNIWVNIEFVEMVSVHSQVAKFTIKDDGIGIAKAKQESIFEEFSQVENRNYNYQGTGLGLSIVRRLLALFGSEISLKSELGKGATFSFFLELECNSYAELKKALTAEAKQEECTKAIKDPNFMPTILIVDDNKINQKITHKVLEKEGFLCDMANNGIKAIELAQDNCYSLILMDINMPKMGGILAAQHIRKFNTKTPIIALTAVEIDEIREEILTAGMNDIILKPYDSAQFMTTVLRNLNSPIEMANKDVITTPNR